MSRLLASLFVLAFLLAPVAAMGQEISQDVQVTVEPTEHSVILGDHIDIVINVTNTGSETLDSLVAHIDITDPTDSTSVDPEDWTATLSKPVGLLGPGETASVTWSIQPISPGSFALYAIALAPGVDTVAASNILAIEVIDQRSLNPNGILPVAIGAPVLVGGLLVTQLRLTSRPRHRRTASD